MKHEFKIGGFWDIMPFAIETNYDLKKEDIEYVCPHVTNGKLPAMVIVSNQGEYDSTGVCLHCIVEAAKLINQL
jgi:hypothetical protein